MSSLDNCLVGRKCRDEEKEVEKKEKKKKKEEREEALGGWGIIQK